MLKTLRVDVLTSISTSLNICFWKIEKSCIAASARAHHHTVLNGSADGTFGLVHRFRETKSREGFENKIVNKDKVLICR